MTIEFLPSTCNHSKHRKEISIPLINRTLYSSLVGVLNCNRHARRYKDDK